MPGFSTNFVCAFCLSLGRVATHRTYENCVNEEEERFLPCCVSDSLVMLTTAVAG